MPKNIYNAYVDFGADSYLCYVKKDAGSLRAFTINSGSNGYFDDYLQLFTQKAIAAYPSEINLTGSLTATGYVHFKTAAGQEQRLYLDSYLYDQLGYTATPIVIKGVEGELSSMQPTYFLQLPRRPLSDNQSSNIQRTQLYSDRKIFTNYIGSRNSRKIQIRFQGFDRAVSSNNEYYNVKRFFEKCWAAGIKFKYYPDSVQSATEYNRLNNPWGWQLGVGTEPVNWDPSQLISGWNYQHLLDLVFEIVTQ